MPTGPHRILVIHDEIEMQVYLSTLLEYSGFNVTIAREGGDGLQIARRERPDLIILGGIMPNVSGGRLYSLLRKDGLTGDIPVVVTSSLARKSFIYYQKIQASAPGVIIPEPEAYLPKPPEKEELLDVVNRLVRVKHKPATEAGQIEETADAS